MPYISTTTRASAPSDRLIAAEIVTTTIFPSQTASAAASSRNHHTQDVPIGAIIGGVCAGAAFALLVTAAWVLWGRSIKRKQRKERKQAAMEKQLLDNTRHNAGRFSAPAAGSYRPLFGLPETRKIKFAPVSTEKAHSPTVAVRPPTPPPKPAAPLCGDDAQDTPRSSEDAPPYEAHDSHGHDSNETGALLPPRPPRTPRTSTPPPLRNTKASRDLAADAKEVPRQSLRSKASAASSASMYSTASGETHRTSRLFSLPAWDHAILHPRWSGSSFAANMLPKRDQAPDGAADNDNIGIAR